MPITISSNIASLSAQRRLSESTTALESISTRLASGQRINRASDDAAGLSIATNLNASARVFSQGMRNISDGVSLLSIAEGALSELSGITIRIMELAEQSANGTFNLSQRKVMAAEADQLTVEYNRIVSTAKFNGVNVLDPSTGEIRIQAGFGIDGSIAVSATDKARTAGDGTFGTASSIVDGFRGVNLADVNGDGKLDIITGPDAVTSSGAVSLGNGDGTFIAPVNYAGGAASGGFYSTVLTGDYNRDGKVDLVFDNTTDSTVSILFGNGDGTFRAQNVYSTGAQAFSLVQGDYNGDGYLDIATSSNTSSDVRILFGNSDGTFRSPTIIATSAQTYSLVSTDFDNDGILDLIAGKVGFQILKGNGDGTFRRLTAPTANSALETWVEAFDMNRDGIADLVAVDNGGGSGTTISTYLGNGDGTFKVSTSYAMTSTAPYMLSHGDLNGDGIEDLLVKIIAGANSQVLLGNTDGTFSYGALHSGLNGFGGLDLGDVNNDGVMDAVGGGGSILVAIGNTRKLSTLSYIDILSQQGARASLTLLQENLNRINLQLGSIGASQSRLNVASRVLANTRDQYKAAESRIADADISEEAASYVRTQILQQAGAAILAQANLSPSLALKLLTA